MKVGRFRRRWRKDPTMITPKQSNRLNGLLEDRQTTTKRFSRAAGKVFSSRRTACVLVLAALIGHAFAQSPSQPSGQLSSQTKSVQDVAVPVPREIFHSLDQFHGGNWRPVKRPEVLQWKSRGDQVQLALLLGTVVAEGFIAMEAEDATKIRTIGSRALSLARGLGVENTVLRRSRSIVDHAEHKEWEAARQEWDAILADLEAGLINLQSEQLSELVSLGGWLRGTEALSALILESYSPERAELLREPILGVFLEKQLLALAREKQTSPTIPKMLQGLDRVRGLMQDESGAPTEKTVREIHSICEELVGLLSGRSSE